MQIEYAPIFKEARDAIIRKGITGAKEHIHKQSEAHPDCEELHALKVHALMWTGDLDGAEAIINQRLQTHPSAAIYGIKCELEQFLGKHDLADESLARAEDLDAENYFCFRSAITVATLAGDHETSLDLIRRCLKLYPEDVETYGSGITAYQSSDLHAEAEELLTNAPDWFKCTADFHSKSGLILMRKLDLIRAEEEFQEAVALCPDEATYWAYLGMAQLHQHKEAESERSSNFALELNSRSLIALRNLATLARRKGDVKAHKEYSQRATASIPALKDMGIASQAAALLHQGKRDEAIQMYRKLAKTGSRTSKRLGQRLLVSTLIDAERWTEARKELDILLETHSHVPAVQVYQLHIEYSEGKEDQALSALDREIDLLEPCAEVYPVAIKLYARSNRVDRLETVIERIKDRLPGSAPILAGVVMQLDNAQRPDDAQEILNQAMRRFPNHPTLKMLEFGLAASRGDQASAMRLYRNLPPNMRPKISPWRLFLMPRFWKALGNALFGKRKR